MSSSNSIPGYCRVENELAWHACGGTENIPLGQPEGYAMNRSYHATLVSHTHWDRAWYVTFQEYRIRLVRLVDRLLDLLEMRPITAFRCSTARWRCWKITWKPAPARGELQEQCRQGASRRDPGTCWPTSFWSAPRH